jgi:hypothetical protein
VGAALQLKREDVRFHSGALNEKRSANLIVLVTPKKIPDGFFKNDSMLKVF